MKKKIKSIVVIIIAIVMLLVLVGCNTSSEQNNLNKTPESKVNFNENEYLAIGYVLDEDLDEFKKQYFNSTENLKEYDFRSEESKDYEQGNTFVIIPKTEDVVISIYNCFLNEEGELELGNTLLDNHKGSFIMIDDYVEVVPHLCAKVKYNDLEAEFYLQFSGKDGTLVLTEVEDVVKDISMYK